MEDTRRSGGVPDLSGQLPNERSAHRGFETHAGAAGRGTRGRGGWRGRGGYRGRGRGRGGDSWGTNGGDVGDAWPESEHGGDWATSMEWAGESFDGEGEWPANSSSSSMEYDPWGGGAPPMSGSDASIYPAGNNGGGNDQRAEGYQRSRSHERELERRSSRERSRERSPPPRPDWKRHQRPPDHDYSTTIDLIARGICKFWNTSRGCSRNSFCKYRHLTPEAEERERYQTRGGYARDRYRDDTPRERERSREHEWTPRSSRMEREFREATDGDRDRDDRKRKRDEDAEGDKDKGSQQESNKRFSASSPTPSSTALPTSQAPSGSAPSLDNAASRDPSFPSLHEFLASVKQVVKKESSNLDTASAVKTERGEELLPSAPTDGVNAGGDTNPPASLSGPAPALALDAGVPPVLPPPVMLPAPTAGDLALYPAYMQACEKMKELLGECELLRKTNDTLQKEKAEFKAKLADARDSKLTKDERERLASYESQVEDLRKQRYVLLKRNSELKDKNEELALSYEHTKKNNAELRKLNESLRTKVEDLEAAAKSSSRSSSRRLSTSSSNDTGAKTEVKSETTSPVAPSPTPTMTPAAPAAQAAVDETTAARIAELEKTAGDMLRKNLDMVRKNMDLIKRFKESEANNVALQTALDEANKAVVDLRQTCASLQSKVNEMEQEEMRRQGEKVETKVTRLADEKSTPTAMDASVGPQVSNSNSENGTQSATTPAVAREGEAVPSAPTEGQ